MERKYSDFLVREDLSGVDPDTDLIIGFEEGRPGKPIGDLALGDTVPLHQKKPRF